MSAAAPTDADVTDLVTTLRDIQKHGTVTKLTGHQIERILAIVCLATSSDLHGGLADVATDDVLDGRPAIS